jgi:hypothetical protein
MQIRADGYRGNDAHDQADEDQQLDRQPHPVRRLVRLVRQIDGLRPEEHGVYEAHGIGHRERAGDRRDIGRDAVEQRALMDFDRSRRRTSPSTGSRSAAARPPWPPSATMASVAVIGMAEKRPDSLRMSRVPASWSMMPAAMNSEALNVAWFIMWKIAATAASGLPNEQRGDQAEMADGRIGQKALQVLLEDREIGAQQQRRQPAMPTMK